jgi:hypothetical protein
MAWEGLYLFLKPVSQLGSCEYGEKRQKQAI